MINRIIILVGILFLFVSPALAEKNEKRFEVGVNVEHNSRFMGNPAGGTIYEHDVYQSSITITDKPTGIYGGVWWSVSPRGGTNDDFGDEIDYFLGIHRTVLEWFEIDAGYAYYNLQDIKNTEGDLHHLHLTMSLPTIFKFSPYITAEKYIPEDKSILDGGFVHRFGVKYPVTLPRFLKKQVVDFDLSLGGHDGAFGTRPEKISSGKLSISSTFKLWKVDVTPNINFQERFGYKEENGGLAEDKVWFGVGFSYKF